MCKAASTKKCAGCAQVYYCGVRCQKAAWKMHRQECAPVKVELVEEKGRGLIATRDIKQGQLVIQDTAIVTMEYTMVTNPDEWDSLVQKVSGLPISDQEIFYSLKPRYGLADEVEMGGFLAAQIVLNNGIALADPGYNSKVGIFPRISILNHSCSPNAKWSQVEGQLDKKEVRALTMIKKGEEVTCCYFGDAQEMVFASRQKRQQFLESWSFECSCNVCGLSQEEKEINELERKKLREKCVGINKEKDRRRKARLCLEKLEMVKKMGLEMFSELSYTYQQVYMACWATEEDEWRMKAELVRLDWRRWVMALPLYSIRFQYSSIISE